jgi:hypothetical protein
MRQLNVIPAIRTSCCFLYTSDQALNLKATYCGSSVGIALGYGLDDRDSIPGGGWELLSSMTLGAHPASYPMGTRGSFPAGKAAGA